MKVGTPGKTEALLNGGEDVRQLFALVICLFVFDADLHCLHVLLLHVHSPTVAEVVSSLSRNISLSTTSRTRDSNPLYLKKPDKLVFGDIQRALRLLLISLLLLEVRQRDGKRVRRVASPDLSAVCTD